jgi:Asp-tRNA(Asn)/Glu-tRNA(Gln) amidotransferase B subunit
VVAGLRGVLAEVGWGGLRWLGGEVEVVGATVLVTGGLDGLYQATVAAGAEPLAAANLIANRLAGIDPTAVVPGELAQLIEARDRIPRPALDEALGKVAEPGFAAAPYLAQEAVSDTAELEPVIALIIEANPDQVAAYRGGKEGLLGFFVGQVLKETGGKANARVVSELVRERLQA